MVFEGLGICRFLLEVEGGLGFRIQGLDELGVCHFCPGVAGFRCRSVRNRNNTPEALNTKSRLKFELQT